MTKTKKTHSEKMLSKYGTHLCTLAFYLYTDAKLTAEEVKRLHGFQSWELVSMAHAFQKTLPLS
jgi:hypothetical protein